MPLRRDGENSNLRRAVRVRPLLALLTVLAVVGLLAFGLLSKGSSGVALGEVAPGASMPRLEGEGSGSLADYRGRWVLVNFWASWCVPCKQEAPALEDFQRRHSGGDFTVLGIDSQDLSGDGKDFARRNGLSYPQLRDGDGKVADDFGTTGVPENFLIDPRGRVRLLLRGPVSPEYLRESVTPLLPDGRS
jgi:cytochrome c biogenesis protein CcmG/thiol:disulfide interchange protein DsbE